MSVAAYPDGFWCAFTATWQRPTGPMSVVLGSLRATTPRLAVYWMRTQAGRVATALDPDPGASRLGEGTVVPYEMDVDVPDPGHFMRDWSRNWAEHEKVMDLLRGGENYTIAAGDYSTVYYLSVQPVVIPFVVAWREANAA